MTLRFPIKTILLTLFTLLISSSVLADDGRINRAPYHFGGDTMFCNQIDGCTLLNKTGLSIANWPQADIATAFALTDQTGQNTRVGIRQGTYGPIQLWSVSPDATTGNNTLCLIGFDEWGKENDMCFPVTPDYQYQPAPLPAKIVLTIAPTAQPTITNTPTATSAPTETATATATSTPTETATATSKPTETATSTPTETATASITPTETETASSTPTETATASSTPTETATASSTPTETATATSTPEPVDCSGWTIGDTVVLIADYTKWGTISSINTGAGTVNFGVHTAGCDEIQWAG